VSIYFEFTVSAMEIHRIYGFPGTRLSGTSAERNEKETKANKEER
jgi:hypothetical protein